MHELTNRELLACETDNEFQKAINVVAKSTGIAQEDLLQAPSVLIRGLYREFIRMMNERAWVKYLTEHSFDELLLAIIEDGEKNSRLEFSSIQSLENPYDIFHVAPFDMTDGQWIVFLALRSSHYWKLHPEEKPNPNAQAPAPLKWTLERILKLKDIHVDG